MIKIYVILVLNIMFLFCSGQNRTSAFEIYGSTGYQIVIDDLDAGTGPLFCFGVNYELSEKWRLGLEYTFSYYSLKLIQAGGDSTNRLKDPAFLVNPDRFFNQAFNHDAYIRAYYTIWNKLEVVGGFSLLNYRQRQEVVSLNGVSLRNRDSARFMFGYHYDLGLGWRFGKFGVNGIYSFVHRSSLQKVFVRISYHFGS
jgi:hypothetical protein